MDTSYWDLDDILCEEEMIECTLLVDIVDLGHLDKNSEKRDLLAHSTVELPYWLAKELYTRRFIQIKKPKFYQRAFQNNLRAEPTAINLQERSPYFYRFGRKLQDKDTLRLLHTSLKARSEDIITKASLRGDDFEEFSSKLTMLERYLYNLRYESKVALRNWKNDWDLYYRPPILRKRKR